MMDQTIQEVAMVRFSEKVDMARMETMGICNISGNVCKKLQ